MDSWVSSGSLGIKAGYKSGGAGEVRTRDNRFRKPMLYPSELQPPPVDSITPFFALRLSTRLAARFSLFLLLLLRLQWRQYERALQRRIRLDED